MAQRRINTALRHLAEADYGAEAESKSYPELTRS